MMQGVEAVAFDIDGTLYPSWKLYLGMTGHFFSNISFFLAFNRVRKILHETAPLADFYEYQARLLAEDMKISVEEAHKKINSISYSGIKNFFEGIKPFRNMYSSIKAMKDAGLKIAVLSDFPPDQKGDIWGVRELCDVCMGSEEAGALKPSIYPFGILSQKLGVKPENILYVGNSIKYDVRGANNAGMKSAYLLTGLRALFHADLKEADVSFRNFKELESIVLKS